MQDAYCSVNLHPRERTSLCSDLANLATVPQILFQLIIGHEGAFCLSEFDDVLLGSLLSASVQTRSE